jgi:hypothetical protein
MHITNNTRPRHVSDSAGIVPLVIGGIGSPSLQGRGLYFDQPICRYTPPRVNLMTGQYDSRVAETAAVVKYALDAAGIKIVDLIRHVEATESYTPLAKIMAEFAACENELLKSVTTHKEKLTTTAAVASTMVLDNIYRAHLRASHNATAAAKLRRVVQGLVKRGKEMTEDAMERTLLSAQSHLQNEEFSGQSQFDNFYAHHVTAKNHDDFQKAKKEMETRSTDAFLHVVSGFHAYYELFLAGTKLNDTNKDTDLVDEWRKIALPLKPDADSSGTACVDNSEHEKKANGLLDNLIWDILLERFEIFASIVEYVFTRIAGPGSDGMRSSVDRFVRMGVLSSMVTAFQTKANMALSDIQTRKFTDAPGRLIQEIVLIHSEFKTWLPTFIHAEWIVDLKLPTDDQMLVYGNEETDSVETMDDNTTRLVAQISADLYAPMPLKENVPGGSFAKLSLKTSKIKDLSIPSTVAALSGEVRRKFEALAPKEKQNALLVVKKGRSSITHLNLTAERERLRDHIIKGMTAVANVAGPVREIFAAKVLTAVYNQDAYFVALFLLKDSESHGRAAIAKEILTAVGSVFKPAAAAPKEGGAPKEGEGHKIHAGHLKAPATLDTTVMNNVYIVADAHKKTAYTHLFASTDATWKDLFALSPEIKIAYERALIKVANTNAQKPAAHRQAPVAAPPPVPNKPAPAGKQTGRPQSAPTKATQQAQKTGKRGGRGRKQQQQQQQPRIQQPRR